MRRVIGSLYRRHIHQTDLPLIEISAPIQNSTKASNTRTSKAKRQTMKMSTVKSITMILTLYLIIPTISVSFDFSVLLSQNPKRISRTFPMEVDASISVVDLKKEIWKQQGFHPDLFDLCDQNTGVLLEESQAVSDMRHTEKRIKIDLVVRPIVLDDMSFGDRRVLTIMLKNLKLYPNNPELKTFPMYVLRQITKQFDKIITLLVQYVFQKSPDGTALRFIGYQHVDELLQTYSTMELMHQVKWNKKLRNNPALYVTVNGPTSDTRNVKSARLVTVHILPDLESEQNEDVIWLKIFKTPPLIKKTFYEEDASQNHPIFQELEGLGLQLLFTKNRRAGIYGDWDGYATHVYVSGHHPKCCQICESIECHCDADALLYWGYFFNR